MKRSLGSSDSLGALMSICPTTDQHSPRNNHVYSREFQSMLDGLDEEGCVDEGGGHVAEKKRRLSVDQVKALEKNFEVENKLEPERKVKLAQELGLQPRQVAVWFQNRRARWKTKQLERDYGVLKANYETLKLNYDALQHDNEALLKEIKELKSKLNEENTESNLSVKEEIIVPETDNSKTLEETKQTPPPLPPVITSSPLAVSDPDQELNYESFNNSANGGLGATLFADLKDGSSDSDSSAILNEDNSPNAAISSSGIVQNQHHQFLMSPASSSFKSPSPPMTACFPFSKPTFQTQVSTFSFATDICLRPNFTVNRCLLNFLDFKSPPSKKPINGVTTSDIIVDSSRNLWFRIYAPTTGGGDDCSLPVIIYFHGGGFALLAANSKLYDNFCRRLAKEMHAIIVSVNYRLSPEHRCPCQYEDGVDALKFIDTTSIECFPACANLKHCFLAGDSAGANLAHHVVVRTNEIDFQKLKLIGVIAIQPFFGGEERTESEIRLTKVPFVTLKLTDWIWKAFLPEGSDRDHPAVNIFGPNSVDISRVNYPTTIVFVGGFDPLQDWQKSYYEGLKGGGKEAYLIEYPNACHWFYAFPELPDSSLLIEKVRDFVESQSAK